jgi:long-chain acyl-CoA synthetase
MADRTDYPWLAHYPKEVDWDMAIEPVALGELLRRTAARFGERPAWWFMGRQTRWADAARDIERVAAGLQRLGLVKGDRIGLLLPNCPAYPTVFFAAMRAGLIVVNFNPLYTDVEIERQARDADVRLMVTLDLRALYPKARALLDAGVVERVLVCQFAHMLPAAKALAFRALRRRDCVKVPRDRRHVLLADLQRCTDALQPVAIDPLRDVALLQYTGGTTGLPKGAMLSHANLYANAVQGGSWFHQMRPGEERVMAALPLFHIFALTTVMMFAFIHGAEMILVPRFSVAEAIRIIARRRVTYLPGVPTMFNAIAAAPGKADLSSIAFCISGGAPLPAEVKRRFEARTGCIVVEGYGLTEASPCVGCNPPGGLNKSGTIGLPMSATVVELRDPEAPAQRVPLGSRGEICVSGPQVMLGYWNQPQETADVFTADGLLRTADIGTMDEEGYVTVVDRIKDVILCGGYNVYPRMVEEAIYRHPLVQACTVIGIPDDYRGETVKAFVIRRPGEALTAEALCTFLRGELSPIEMPKHIEFRDTLPMTLVGKLSKKELVEEEKAKYAARTAAGLGANLDLTSSV